MRMGRVSTSVCRQRAARVINEQANGQPIGRGDADVARHHRERMRALVLYHYDDDINVVGWFAGPSYEQGNVT